MKMTLDEKLRLVKLRIEDGVPVRTIQDEYGLDRSTLNYLCALYRRWGEVAFQSDIQRKTYSRETKLNAIHDVLVMKKSQNSIALDLMLTNPKVLSDWINKYQNEGEEAIKDTFSREAYKLHDDKVLEKEYKKLLDDLERTKAENEFLKKSYSLILERGKQTKK